MTIVLGFLQTALITSNCNRCVVRGHHAHGCVAEYHLVITLEQQ